MDSIGRTRRGLRPEYTEKGNSILPVPTRIWSNGELDSIPQTREQRQVQEVMMDLADRFAGPHGMDRRRFLGTACGLATAFLAMNMVHGTHFDVSVAEAADSAAGEERAEQLSSQFIFDDQLHYVHDGYERRNVVWLRKYAKRKLNLPIKGEKTDRSKLRFMSFFKEVFLESDTKVGLLSSAPADDKGGWFLSNQQLAQGRDRVSSMLGARRLLCHAVFTPGHPGWHEGIDRAISECKPDAWKGYTVGDPSRFSRFPFRLDDEKLVYPAYEKFLKAGIRNVCIHKGLMPFSFFEKFGNWRYGKVDDLPKAAKDWPDLNFIIYHAAFSPLLLIPRGFLKSFEKTGRIEWVTDLAEIPQKHGVKNVYADIGTTFAVTAVMHPRLAAGVLGALIKGLGEDHVLWGTDSVWYGSPQWQIEALRRIEIPADLQEKHGFAPLGGADSEVKEKILGRNGAKLYGLNPESVEYRRGAKLAAFKEP